jgi:hypothetical protein
MIRTLFVALLATSTAMVNAQTLAKISNITITEKEDVRKGTDVMAEMPRGEGSDRVVIYADQNMMAETRVKVSTHNVRRSSVKDGAINVIFEIDLVVDGKKDNRRVEKIFYAEQERRSRINEKFTVKRGTNVRVITVAYDIELL